MLRKSPSRIHLPAVLRESITRLTTRGFADTKKVKFPKTFSLLTFFLKFFLQPCSVCPDEIEQTRQSGCDEKTKQHEEPLCIHHSDLVPEFDNLKNLKSFELKSSCNKFHWISEGHDR